MPVLPALDHFLTPAMLQSALAAAFAEDMGGYGDVTTLATIQPEQKLTANLVARQAGILAGIDIAKAAFAYLDTEIAFSAHTYDGTAIQPGQQIGTISGPAASILGAERVALNFLSHLSGIASLTAQYVAAIAGTKAKITCTRKTRPLLRAFEKYAVRAGGGHNHRFNLSDAVLIKDNHIAANHGNIAATVQKAKAMAGHMLRISVEIDDIAQIEPAITNGAEVLLLDNMPPTALRQAVKQINQRVITEASGGITLDNIAAIAATGVDYIAVGRITHSAPWLDIGLDC